MCRAPRYLYLYSTMLLVAGTCSFFAQPGKAQNGDLSSQNDAITYTLNGTVVNSVTGEPISRALVQLNAGQPRIYARGQDGAYVANSGHSPRAMLTDREGRFKFEGLPRGRTPLSAKKPGFFSQEELSENWFHGGHTEASPDVPTVTVRLVPEAVIVGEVTDANGELMEGVEIRISSLSRANGRKQLMPQTRGTRTGEDGAFRMAHLPPGTYYVTAAPYSNRNGIDSAESKTAYPLTYYPGVAEFSEATPLALSAGQHAKIDLTLRETPVVKVTGLVTGYPRGQQVHVQFTNQSGDSISLDEQFDSQTGRFEARVVVAGLCTIKADSEDLQQKRLHAELTFDPASPKTVHLNLTPASSIPVVIRTERTKPQTEPQATQPEQQGIGFGSVPKARVLDIPASVILHAIDFRRPDVGASAEEGPNGVSLVLRNIESGKYKVEAIPNPAAGSWYVKSILYGSKDLMREELTVGTGDASAIEIVLRDDGAVLRGSVRSGDTAARAAVLVVPDYAPFDPKMALAGDNGAFQIAGLAPGEYKVFAFDRLDGLEYANGNALEPYASKAAQVSLRPNDKTTVNVDLIPRGE